MAKVTEDGGQGLPETSVWRPVVSSRVGRKLKNFSDFLCHGDVNMGYRIRKTSAIASALRAIAL